MINTESNRGYQQTIRLFPISMQPFLPRVLLTNDDGPPDRKDSPYVFGLYLHLSQTLGWDVKVVLPSSQKSWIGKAYHIKEVATGVYYYPKSDGSQGETSPRPRPLKEDELAEWILLDGTPATCANVALHNLYPGQIDLVISGPNYGRNTSSAFALSSGTIGAALSSSLSGVRSIAVSYGTVLRPTPPTLFEPAHLLSLKILKDLWENWGNSGFPPHEVDLYNVNIPLIEQLLSPEGLKVCWTKMWRNKYGSLFKAVSDNTDQRGVLAASPDSAPQDATSLSDAESNEPRHSLRFRFAPDIAGLISPNPATLPVGSDGWALSKGWASVTPLKASFGEPGHPFADDNLKGRLWKL
ncbi:sure-like protein [Pluteus cervinus]|uniref:Sure-like protein n=1 Tax=Pluteus cervinus TaxID=181527 RepID=A0ACD3BIX4_9AGAR|nr:sure-like protein [Pluteus cervinus]